jgi:hypothetical protein
MGLHKSDRDTTWLLDRKEEEQQAARHRDIVASRRIVRAGACKDRFIIIMVRFRVSSIVNSVQ